MAHRGSFRKILSVFVLSIILPRYGVIVKVKNQVKNQLAWKSSLGHNEA